MLCSTFFWNWSGRVSEIKLTEPIKLILINFSVTEMNEIEDIGTVGWFLFINSFPFFE